MKSSRLITLALASIFSLLATFPTTTIAADAAWVAGDLKVDGLWFSGDPSKTVIRKPSDFSAPWTILGSDIYYLTGNIGIGTMTPATKLDVNGTVKATSFQGDGTGLSNVTASSVVNGAVGDAQITGPISAAKLDLSTVQKKYGKIAVVAQSGGDYTDPATAMGDYATWCGTPSTANPCMLKIMPGVYTMTSAVVMRQYIDIEGSGEKVTKITSALSSTSTNPLTVATVQGANNAELRFLTVENTGTGIYSTAMMNTSASPSLLNVTATATGGGTYNYGVYNYNYSSPTMTNLTVTAKGGTDTNYGVYNNSSSSPSMTNVTVAATGVGAVNYGVYNNFYSGGNMTNVSVNPSGATSNYGVYNNSSSPLMMNVNIKIFGGVNSYGVYNFSSTSQPTMTNSSVFVGFASQNSYGVYNSTSTFTLTNSTVTGIGATLGSYGVYNTSSSGTVKIDHSVIKGITNTIFNTAGATIRIGNSQLDGGAVSNAGTLTCAGVYDENYVFYASTCP